MQCSGASSLLPSFDPSLQTSGRELNEMRFSQRDVRSREQEIVRKGIERLKKQILQYITVHLSKDQINIALIKKCNTTDIPAVNSAIGNIQKALQRYVGFNGMDPEYCDQIGELMDDAQAWCQDIEELYNKAGVHSINTSKGDSVDVGIFSDNSKVTGFEFLDGLLGMGK